ncbi:unnamed protein product [Musa hybrid cultivar]
MPADALLLSLLQQLIVWLIKDAYRQVAAARGVERELERLERTVPGIQAMLAIHLGGCRKCQHLPPFWPLPSLEVLLSSTEIDAIKHIIYGVGSYSTILPLLPSIRALYVSAKKWMLLRSIENLTTLVTLDIKVMSGRNIVDTHSSIPHGRLSFKDLDSLGELRIGGCEELGLLLDPYDEARIFNSTLRRLELAVLIAAVQVVEKP